MDLWEEYRDALRSYLVKNDEAALARAYELGRRGLSSGLGVLEMVALQHRALAAIVEERPWGRGEMAPVVKAALSFLMEGLTPFEIVHRGFRETNAVLHRLNQTLEEEAGRIARALHDEAGQLLAVVHIALDELSREVPPAAQEKLGRIRGFLNQIEGHLRSLSHEIRPTILDDLGLVPALESLAKGVSARMGLAIRTDGSELGTRRLPQAVETTLYRIVQEALNNVARHAEASSVAIRVWQDGKVIRASVRDDGIGFDVPSVLDRRGERGLGLMGIRERLRPLDGSLEIRSSPGGGTELLVAIPLED